MTPPRIIILAFLLIHIQLIAQNKSVYVTHFERITLDGNRFEYFWHRIYDVGALDDTVQHTGTFIRKGDTLIMTSDKKFWFNNYNSIKSVEKKLNLDSTYIVISSMIDTLPLFFVQPLKIRINDYYYPLELTTSDSIRIIIPKQRLKYIYVPGYPVYNVKNPDSDYFHFYINLRDDINEKLPDDVFFFNEKFLLKGDTLFHLKNDTINIYNMFLREK